MAMLKFYVPFLLPTSVAHECEALCYCPSGKYLAAADDESVAERAMMGLPRNAVGYAYSERCRRGKSIHQRCFQL